MAEKRVLIDYEKRLNKNHNKGLIGLIAVIIMGYAFFFLSPLIFHEKPNKELSPLNQEIVFVNGRVKINSWEYSPKQHAFEVCCTTSGINPDDITIEASCNFTYKTKGSKALPTAIGYKQSDYFVVYVVDIPEDWYCVSIRATRKTNSTPDETGKENKGEDTQNYGYLYTCVEDVQHVEEIENNKTKTTYVIERDQRIIEYDKSIIESNEKEIRSLNSQIEDWKSDIHEIEEERPFQIDSERKQSDSRIRQLQDSIAQSNRKIEQIELKNSELQREIAEYKTVIWRLNNSE